MAVSNQRKGRIIFHIDMNCFYASVEMAYNPSLKGKPIAIAGNPEERRGVIVTSSYEARAKGVKTTMNIWQAKKLCPDLIVMKPNFDRYRAASRELFRILSEITPYVQPVSIDEGYMDVTDVHQSNNALELAHVLQQKILMELDLPCSIGIAPNKFLAKMGSDMKKPLGITVLRKRELNKTLWPLSVSQMYGVGEKTADKLNALGIETIGDLAKSDTYQLKQVFGINGERLKNRANGIDLRPVDPDAIYDFKSIGNSQTLPEDTIDIDQINKLMTQLADNVERRMKRKNVAGKSVQLMIRYHNRKTITRSKKLQSYIDKKEEILIIAQDLFHRHWTEEPIRLLGITVQDVEEKQNIGKQLDLFTYEDDASKETLFSTIDKLTEKYGENPFIRIQGIDTNNDQPRTSFQKDFLDDFKK
ncbi:DNA polymerase IV [Oceanobacillus piezotolerans]|uniref:DNA polymerase IV n=1 Tax=Oceanobacillus piezotolerans TaxID=2448030 RepID=A0A498DHY1_9BACI|nr:DNA polymerase IV [Oceanobacillus piezotolerans]RLL48139.1 DNA polymerase IV [Oceanobacillus piezotolerans]